MAGSVVATAGLYIGVKTAGMGFVAGNWAWKLVQGAYERATRIVIPTPDERLVEPSVLNRRVTEVVGLARPEIVTPRIETKHARGATLARADSASGFLVTLSTVEKVQVRYGTVATERVLPKLLAKINRSGGKPVDERIAVGVLERVSGDHVPDLYTGLMNEWARTDFINKPLKDYGWRTLALEMALQEQRERELLAGELLDLELAWKEAEELARIADTLVPSSIDRALAKLKARMDR